MLLLRCFKIIGTVPFSGEGTDGTLANTQNLLTKKAAGEDTGRGYIWRELLLCCCGICFNGFNTIFFGGNYRINFTLQAVIRHDKRRER
jgi:hypothetical protein